MDSTTTDNMAADAQAGSAAAGIGSAEMAGGPSRPPTVLPAEHAPAQRDMSDPAVASSSAMPPPPAPAKAGEITIKEWEWISMTLVNAWMCENDGIRALAHSHMNDCDVATATGVIKCLSPAREEALRSETALDGDSYQYVYHSIADWVRMFRAGPRARGYQVPSLPSDAGSSHPRPSDTSRNTSRIRQAHQVLGQLRGQHARQGTLEGQESVSNTHQQAPAQAASAPPPGPATEVPRPSVESGGWEPSEGVRSNPYDTDTRAPGFEPSSFMRPFLQHRRSLDSFADSVTRSDQLAYLRSLEDRMRDAELHRTQDQTQHQQAWETRFRDLEARTQREAQRQAMRVHQVGADSRSRALETRVQELEQQLAQQRDVSAAPGMPEGPVMSGGLQQEAPRDDGTQPSQTHRATANHQATSSAAANPFNQGQQPWAGYGGGSVPQQSHNFMPHYGASQGQNQWQPMGRQHSANAFSRQYGANASNHQHGGNAYGQVPSMYGPDASHGQYQGTWAPQDSVMNYPPARPVVDTHRRRRLKPEEIMIFDPKDWDVSFFTRRLRVVALQEGEQPVLDMIPFCLRGRALEWHTQLPEEAQMDMSLSLPRAIALLEREFRPDPLEARRQAKSVTFSFDNVDKLPLADYLSKKITLLRAAGTTDTATIKDEIWDSMDHTLAYLVQPQPDEPLTDYTARIRAAESGARRTWEAYRFRPANTHQGQADRVRSVLARLSNNADRMTPKPEPKSGSADNDGNKPKPTRVMSRPCRHCGGGHWDNECTKKKVHFATTETEEPSDDEVDVDLLERLADELDDTSKN